MNPIIAAALLFAGTISWNMTNTYSEPGTNGEATVTFGAMESRSGWTAGCGVSPQELDELRRKVDVMWTDYTNRMERARIHRERRDAMRNRPPSSPFRVKKGVRK